MSTNVEATCVPSLGRLARLVDAVADELWCKPHTATSPDDGVAPFEPPSLRIERASSDDKADTATLSCLSCDVDLCAVFGTPDSCLSPDQDGSDGQADCGGDGGRMLYRNARLSCASAPLPAGGSPFCGSQPSASTIVAGSDGGCWETASVSSSVSWLSFGSSGKAAIVLPASRDAAVCRAGAEDTSACAIDGVDAAVVTAHSPPPAGCDPVAPVARLQRVSGFVDVDGVCLAVNVATGSGTSATHW